MTTKDLIAFVRLANGAYINAYTDGGTCDKVEFHRLAKKILREVANRLGLEKGTFDIRTNMGGIAVCGETTLHGESIYIQLAQSSVGSNTFFYRHCKGRRDYTGGVNRWMMFDKLLDLETACEAFQQAIAAAM